jgi:hypothetical protein
MPIQLLQAQRMDAVRTREQLYVKHQVSKHTKIRRTSNLSKTFTNKMVKHETHINAIRTD